MAITGDNRPLNLTPTRRGFGWWNIPGAEPKSPSQPAPSSLSPSKLTPSSFETAEPSPLSPMPMDMTEMLRPRKKRRVVIDELPKSTDQELFDMNIADKIGPEPTTLASTRQLHRSTWALLKRFQQAYREQTVVIAQLQTDLAKANSSRQEEINRSNKVKKTLQEAKKIVWEQETSIKELMIAVTNEKKARIQQSEQIVIQPPAQDVDMLTSPGASGGSAMNQSNKARISVPSSAGSVLSEDLGVEGDQTDNESTAEDASIFSRSRSPTLRSSVGNSDEIMSLHRAPTASSSISFISGRSVSMASTSTLAAQRSQQLTPTSGGLGKLFKGFEGGVIQQVEIVTSCSNCQNEPASIAWETVSSLRDENKDLKNRVAEIETHIDGALDAVNGVATLVVSMHPKPKQGAEVRSATEKVEKVEATAAVGVKSESA